MLTRVRIPGEDEIGLQRSEVDEDLRLEWAQIHAE